MEPAPPYTGEGPHALWHVSEDPTLTRFKPRGDFVWAIDTRHLPLYWFPRDCPRATFWAHGSTSGADVARFLGGDRTKRVHVIEPEWIARMHSTRVFAYRMPEETFERSDRFWVSRVAVEAIERKELGDLVELHSDARIELRTAPGLLRLWDHVVASTLDFSGIRLRNARLAS